MDEDEARRHLRVARWKGVVVPRWQHAGAKEGWGGGAWGLRVGDGGGAAAPRTTRRRGKEVAAPGAACLGSGEGISSEGEGGAEGSSPERKGSA